MNINSSFTPKSPKLETIQMLISKWMDKQVVVHSSHEILPSNKDQKATEIHNLMDESQKRYAEWKKSTSFMIPFTWRFRTSKAVVIEITFIAGWR